MFPLERATWKKTMMRLLEMLIPVRLLLQVKLFRLPKGAMLGVLNQDNCLCKEREDLRQSAPMTSCPGRCQCPMPDCQLSQPQHCQLTRRTIVPVRSGLQGWVLLRVVLVCRPPVCLASRRNDPLRFVREL